ncbi:MAG: hypothetical protein Q9159_007048 [Coniocarpon cinnabarinum]
MPPPFQEASSRIPDFDTISDMLSAGQFRLAAREAASRLTSCVDPADHSTIFSLLYVRLACLSALDYQYEAAQEAQALQDFNGSFYRDSSTGVHLAPFELRLLVVKLQAVGLGDWRRCVIGFYDMARECRWHHGRSKDASLKSVWKLRLSDLGAQVAHALVQMGDLDAAARHLTSLLSSPSSKHDHHLSTLLQLSMVCLHVGDVAAAKHWLRVMSEESNTDDVLSKQALNALIMTSNGEYSEAATEWQNLANDVGEGQEGLKTLSLQNKAARVLLDGLTKEQNMPHEVTFNLATLFELTAENARNLKLTLAQRLATHGASSMGNEKFNADFKL